MTQDGTDYFVRLENGIVVGLPALNYMCKLAPK